MSDRRKPATQKRSQAVRAMVTAETAKRLRHLAIDEGKAVRDLLDEGIELVLLRRVGGAGQ